MQYTYKMHTEGGKTRSSPVTSPSRESFASPGHRRGAGHFRTRAENVKGGAAGWRAAVVGALLSISGAPECTAGYGIGFESGPVERSETFSARPALVLRGPTRGLPKVQSPTIQLAHAIVVRTSPPQSGVGGADIGKVEVWYDAGIRDAFAALAVVSAAGERVDKRDAAIDSADPAHVSVSVNRLSPGKYTARYRALSADGHLVSGAWEFEVNP